jgi:hypothetical protein
VFAFKTACSAPTRPLSLKLNWLSPDSLDVKLSEGRTVFLDYLEGFDQDPNATLPAGWQADGTDGDYVWDQVGHSGHRSLRVNRHAGPWHGFHSPVISVKPNTHYIVSFWGKYSGTGTCGARAVVTDADNQKCYDASVCQTRSADWAPASAIFTTWTNTTRVRINVQLHGFDSDGDVWFDDVQLEEME